VEGEATILNGVAVVGTAMLLAALTVWFARRYEYQELLAANKDFVAGAYPIIGLIYGVFLAFTVVIAWQKFNDAETSATEETTHLSQLWRDSEPLRESYRAPLQDQLLDYVQLVRSDDWPSMARTGMLSDSATVAYERIWQLFYEFEPDELEERFFNAAITELNSLGRVRRLRGLYASAEVQPLVKVFLVGGGVMTVAFSLLVACGSRRLQMLVTSLMAGLTAFSIFLVLSLQRPFSGDLSVTPLAFDTLERSFDERIQRRTRTHRAQNGDD